jgi:magnesium-transporting ATPase (P-type)
MITGDNSLTGSNIGYKCGISFKDKGMLIVDYKDGRFTEEKFIYRERGEEEDNKENTKMSFEGSEEPHLQSNLLSEPISSPNKAKLPPI